VTGEWSTCILRIFTTLYLSSNKIRLIKSRRLNCHGIKHEWVRRETHVSFSGKVVGMGQLVKPIGG
jgi:hypothetical protein